MLKYHNLLGNKLFSTLNKIEVTTTEEAVEAKQEAFMEALKDISGRIHGTSPTNGPH
jgi:hypothetical protein